MYTAGQKFRTSNKMMKLKPYRRSKSAIPKLKIRNM